MITNSSLALLGHGINQDFLFNAAAFLNDIGANQKRPHALYSLIITAVVSNCTANFKQDGKAYVLTTFGRHEKLTVYISGPLGCYSTPSWPSP